MPPMLFETLQIAVLLGFMAFLARLWSRRAERRADLLRLHLEGRNRLLERLDTAQALLDFAATGPGRALLEPPALAEAAPQPRREGLRLVQAGLVALFVGLGSRSTYHLAMNWRAANLHLNETEAFRRALNLWQWSEVCTWMGAALLLCGLLSALLAHLARRREAQA